MIVEFDPIHLYAADFAPAVRETAMHASTRIKLLVLGNEALSKTVLSISGAEVLGFVAAIPVTKDRCEVVVVQTRTQKKHPKEFAKGVQAAIRMIIHRFKHIQTLGSEDPKISRWLSWLGFEREGYIDRPEFNGEKTFLWVLKDRARYA